jgi:hypothetical protein
MAQSRARTDGRGQAGSQRGTQGLVVTSFKLDNWRNFLHVDVALQRRVFLVGPNASGKSNFLDAFRFLADLASVGGGFQEAVERRGGVSRLRALSARRYPEIRLDVAIGNVGDRPLWRA